MNIERVAEHPRGARTPEEAAPVSHQWVETTQIAPTIVRLVGLDPSDLQAVQIEGTQVLPTIGR